MKNLVEFTILFTLLTAFAVVVLARSQVGSKVLTCEEITGRLYIANAQLSQELQETRAQLSEIRVKCGERCAVETKP